MKQAIPLSHLRAACATGHNRLCFNPRADPRMPRITAFSAAGTSPHQSGMPPASVPRAAAIPLSPG